MASKLVVAVGIAALEAILLAGSASLIWIQKGEVKNALSAVATAKGLRTDYESRIASDAVLAKARDRQLEEAMVTISHLREEVSALKDAPPRFIIPSTAPATKPTSLQQAAADRRAEWARDHASQTTAGKGPVSHETPGLSVEDEVLLEARRANLAALAKQESRNYFYHRWRPGSEVALVTNVEVTFDSIEPKPTEVGKWHAVGAADIDYYIKAQNSTGAKRVKFSAELDEAGGANEFNIHLLN